MSLITQMPQLFPNPAPLEPDIVTFQAPFGVVYVIEGRSFVSISGRHRGTETSRRGRPHEGPLRPEELVRHLIGDVAVSLRHNLAVSLRPETERKVRAVIASRDPDAIDGRKWKKRLADVKAADPEQVLAAAIRMATALIADFAEEIAEIERHLTEHKFIMREEVERIVGEKAATYGFRDPGAPRAA